MKNIRFEHIIFVFQTRYVNGNGLAFSVDGIHQWTESACSTAKEIANACSNQSTSGESACPYSKHCLDPTCVAQVGQLRQTLTQATGDDFIGQADPCVFVSDGLYQLLNNVHCSGGTAQIYNDALDMYKDWLSNETNGCTADQVAKNQNFRPKSFKSVEKFVFELLPKRDFSQKSLSNDQSFHH